MGAVLSGALLTAVTLKLMSALLVVWAESLKLPVTVTVILAAPFQSVAPVKCRLFRKELTCARVPVVPNWVPVVKPSVRVPLPVTN